MSGSVMIILAWPAPELFPNYKAHWRMVAAAKKSHRNLARLSVLNWMNRTGNAFAFSSRDDLPIEVAFHPPDNRRRDVDGVLSACKAYLDGVADAIGIDDRRFNPITVTRLQVKAKGEIVIEI